MWNRSPRSVSRSYALFSPLTLGEPSSVDRFIPSRDSNMSSRSHLFTDSTCVDENDTKTTSSSTPSGESKQSFDARLREALLDGNDVSTTPVLSLRATPKRGILMDHEAATRAAFTRFKYAISFTHNLPCLIDPFFVVVVDITYVGNVVKYH
jgi:hypothetical protein